jgi:HEAT repeat protein
MKRNSHNRKTTCDWMILAVVMFAFVGIVQTGCSEGPLWRASRFAPWVQKKWAADEQIAETVYSKRAKLREIAATGKSLSPSSAEQYAQRIDQILQNEQTLIVRVEAVRTLGKLQCELSDELLQKAIKDNELDVRIAAVQAMKHRDSAVAIATLEQVVSSDSSDDVRREALRSLGAFKDPEAVQVLARVLDDRDPATQYRAIQSLQSCTGQRLGPNVAAWREYLGTNQLEQSPTAIAKIPADEQRK